MKSLIKASRVPCFRECWIFSSCRHLIRHCDELVAVESGISAEVGLQYENLKSEVLHIARLQLDHLGIAFQLFDNPIYHRSKDVAKIILPENGETSLSLDGVISNSVLLHAVQNIDDFGVLYEVI